MAQLNVYEICGASKSTGADWTIRVHAENEHQAEQRAPRDMLVSGTRVVELYPEEAEPATEKVEVNAQAMFGSVMWIAGAVVIGFAVVSWVQGSADNSVRSAMQQNQITLEAILIALVGLGLAVSGLLLAVWGAVASKK